MKKFIFYFFLVVFSSTTYPFSLFEKKFTCFDKDYPDQKYSLVFNSDQMSVMGPELSNPLVFTECRKNSHESKYELKSMGCKETRDERLWSFNKITNILLTNKYPGIRQQTLVCKKI